MRQLHLAISNQVESYRMHVVVQGRFQASSRSNNFDRKLVILRQGTVYRSLAHFRGWPRHGGYEVRQTSECKVILLFRPFYCLFRSSEIPMNAQLRHNCMILSEKACRMSVSKTRYLGCRGWRLLLKASNCSSTKPHYRLKNC